MVTVGVAVEDDGAAGQAALVSRALDVLQPDLPPADHGTAEGRFGQAAPQLQAHHVCLAEVPAVVANSPPLAVVDHFHPARTLVVTIYQPDPIYRAHKSFTTWTVQKWEDDETDFCCPDSPKASIPSHRTPKRPVKVHKC